MELINIVLTDSTLVRPLLHKLDEHGYRGSVVKTEGIHHALVDADGDGAMFGGLRHVMAENTDQLARPIIQVVSTIDGEAKKISKIVHEVVEDLTDKGFIYVVPVTYIEGLK